jgi:23S rRNA (uracil1939-C5)-methyltransferase
MLDLYCGVGTFSLFLKDYFEEIDLVEQNKDALALAVSNVGQSKDGKIHNFFAESCENFTKSGDFGLYDFAVCDPPRAGLAQSVRTALLERPPRVLAYVSCDPVTLARDAKALCGGYTLESISLHDFYPQTSHIETLAVFTRKEVSGL